MLGMADQGNPPTGPDLAAGVGSDELRDGTMMAGRFGGDAVLLARTGGRCFAIGATCTHYGGPLAEGLLDGAIVHCPWHHAKFDLRTGVAVGPPAIDSQPCWHVEEKDGRVRVLDKLSAIATPRVPDATRTAAPES